MNPSELSFDSRYGVQSGHPHHFGNQMHAGNTLQVYSLLCCTCSPPLNKFYAVKEILKNKFLQSVQFGQPTSAAEHSRVQWVFPNNVYQVRALCRFLVLFRQVSYF